MELKATIQKIDALKKEIDSLRPISKENEIRIWQKFRLDWNFHSNNLEGNSLTYGETKALILFNITASGKPLKDHFEITGHNEALKYIEEIIKQQRPLTEAFIRELHTIILKEPYKKDAITPEGLPTTRTINIGIYKKEPNHVKTISGEIFYFAKPEETPAMMQELMEWYNKNLNSKDIHPLLFASEFHYKFIRIHPFDDGNGRMARILMNFILMMKDFPPIIVKTQEKDQYFRALEQADSGNLETFINYLGEQLIKSLELYIKGAKGEVVEEPDDIDKQITLIKAKLNSSITESVATKRTIESQSNIFTTSLKPLLSDIFNKLEKLDIFFERKTIWIGKNNENKSG
ncbi:MAG: Fic family protein, partial [Cytophagaceae bacterium]|nr:Fic family protein [Cytophagaceae bacterium]